MWSVSLSARADVRLGGSWGRSQRLRNAAWYRLVRATLWLADRLPARLLLSSTTQLGRLAWLLSGRLRADTRRALAAARGACDRSKLPAPADILATAGRNLGSCLLLRRANFKASDVVSWDEADRQAFVDALAEGRGAVFVSAHLGPFELLPAFVAEQGFAPAVVVRESYDPRLDALVDAHRLRRGLRVIHRGAPSAGFAIVRALRTGAPVGFLPDLPARVAGLVPVELLGVPAAMPVGPARIALRARCPVLVGTLEDAGARRLRLRVERVELAADEDELTLTRRLALLLGARVSQSPAQWLWPASALARSQA